MYSTLRLRSVTRNAMKDRSHLWSNTIAPSLNYNIRSNSVDRTSGNFSVPVVSNMIPRLRRDNGRFS
ncbi:MAG: hypothetical protein WBL95_18210 [Microcoleus sp.]